MGGTAHFLDGGGEMASAIRARNWSATPLGPLEDWPPALKTALGMALNSKFPKCIAWGPELTTFYNDAFRPILGSKPEALGQSFREVWQEAWAEIGPIAERALAGEATFIEDFPLVIDRHGYPEQCYFTFCYSPIRDEDGVVRGMMDTVIETTTTVETQHQTNLLAGELEHRIKNVMSVISAIVSQTLRSAGLEGEAKTLLSRRIAALADAQSLLSGGQGGTAGIGDVIARALRPFEAGDDRFAATGPAVQLSARQAQTLALAINELATNATKYGALSVPSGQVRIAWSAGRPGSNEEFCLDWSESGGPPVAEPKRRGFGSRIIEQALAHEFHGTATLAYEAGGLTCALRTEMLHLGEQRQTAA